ncbi:hypothetical protein LZ086_18765 (plasmid) [Acinetobacter johnsonii]|jgi:hypothetical protein|nr:hypothetical protein LZ086_18765 [Acinetobacter johnsonii]
MATALDSKLLKGAMLTGVINAFINGGIQYFFLKEYSSIAISVDSITNNEDTVLGTSVLLSITLAIILTMVAYFGIKEKKVDFFPTAFWLTIKHGFFTFGILTSIAVLWQKYVGTVEVSLVSALVIIGIIAGIVSGVVNYLTLRECTLAERYKNEIH